MAPKQLNKADVLVALGKRDPNLKESGSSSEDKDTDAHVEEEEEGTGDEGKDSNSEASA